MKIQFDIHDYEMNSTTFEIEFDPKCGTVNPAKRTSFNNEWGEMIEIENVKVLDDSNTVDPVVTDEEAISLLIPGNIE
jgi:hypothetical protein